jgi:hypothetical protein
MEVLVGWLQAFDYTWSNPWLQYWYQIAMGVNPGEMGGGEGRVPQLF